MPFTPEEIKQLMDASFDYNVQRAAGSRKALYDAYRLAVMDGNPVGFEGKTIPLDRLKIPPAVAAPRVWRSRCVFSNLSHRQRLSSKQERQEHVAETARRQILERIGKNASYKEKHDHKRGEVTATLEVELSSIFDASVSGRHFTEILAEAQAETRNRVSELLDSAIRALDVRGDYNDDVRADQLRDIKDKIEAALTHGEDNMDGSAGGLSGVGL